MHRTSTAEHRRLEEARSAGGKKWRRWGTYLTERQWGTVREDYSANGDAWDYLPLDHAPCAPTAGARTACSASATTAGSELRASRSGTGTIRSSRSVSSASPGTEGNHGEDVKELYWYLDATPTCSYARALYKYPQRAFPYDELRAPRAGRGQDRRRAGDPRHGGLRRRPVLRRATSSTRRPTRTTSLVRITVTNRGPRRGDARRPAAALVSQHVELERRGHRGPSCSRSNRPGKATASASSRRSRSTSGDSGCTWRGPTSCSSRRTRRTRRASAARRTRVRT